MMFIHYAVTLMLTSESEANTGTEKAPCRFFIKKDYLNTFLLRARFQVKSCHGMRSCIQPNFWQPSEVREHAE